MNSCGPISPSVFHSDSLPSRPAISTVCESGREASAAGRSVPSATLRVRLGEIAITVSNSAARVSAVDSVSTALTAAAAAA